MKTRTKVTLAHSVDADDAFMFYALSKGIIRSENIEFINVLKDIQTLNQEARNFKYDIQAISFFAYPDIENDYQLLSCGGSLGYGYGPTVVGKEKANIKDLNNKTIAIPGDKTTAFLLLSLLVKNFKPVCVPFDEIIDAVASDEYPFGLIIHEGQLSYERKGLSKIVDLGKWWLKEFNLPVPLGGNVIKRSFNAVEKKEINSLLRKSISYAIEHKESVVPEIMKYARDIKDDIKLVDKFVSMYVNNYTIDYDADGKQAIEKLFRVAYANGLINKVPKLDFVE